MKTNITISLYNRPEYTKQVFEHLDKCYSVENFQILVLIDKSPYQDELEEIVSYYSSHLDIHAHTPSKNLGCNKAIYECLDWGFEDADFNIHIEDDILLSADALQYFTYCANKFSEDKTVFTVDGYNNDTSLFNIGDLHKTNMSTSFKPWGWATWKDRWLEIKDKWQFGYGSKYENGDRVFDGGGWDVCMKKYLRKHRNRVYPLVARVKNIGAVGGVHTPNKEWHDKKHGLAYWADDFKSEGDPGIDHWNINK